MTTESQNIAIARFCGVKPQPSRRGNKKSGLLRKAELAKSEIEEWIAARPKVSWPAPRESEPSARYPDYTNDLNAMLLAERALSPVQRAVYARGLNEAAERADAPKEAGSLAPILAPATQRAEAFLKALRLWEEEK